MKSCLPPAIDLHGYFAPTAKYVDSDHVPTSLLHYFAPALTGPSHLRPVGLVIGLEAFVVTIDRLLSSA